MTKYCIQVMFHMIWMTVDGDFDSVDDADEQIQYWRQRYECKSAPLRIMPQTPPCPTCGAIREAKGE
jgi:hypothetical protein